MREPSRLSAQINTKQPTLDNVRFGLLGCALQYRHKPCCRARRRSELRVQSGNDRQRLNGRSRKMRRTGLTRILMREPDVQQGSPGIYDKGNREDLCGICAMRRLDSTGARNRMHGHW
jgi:hypothetical protein